MIGPAIERDVIARAQEVDVAPKAEKTVDPLGVDFDHLHHVDAPGRAGKKDQDHQHEQKARFHV